jgi:glutamate carboxypeptidase
MKGGDVIIVAALSALHRAGVLEGRRIVVLFTGDEEDAGMPTEVSRKALRAAASRSDVALAFEGVVDDTATVARRGASAWRLTVSARTGHSSGIFGDERGHGAIFEAARILDAFRREVPEKYLTLNPSVVAGGTTAALDPAAKTGTAEGKLNVIPARVIVEGDLRFLTAAQEQATREKMRAITARSLPKAEARLDFTSEYPALSPSPGNDRVLAVLDRVSRDLGLGPVKPLDPGRRGAGDISFVPPELDRLDGLGANGGGAHTADEWVDLDFLAPQAKKAALLIERLTRP